MQTPFGDWLPEVLVFHPTRFEDAQAILIAVRELRTVVVDAAAMERRDAQRLIDFVAGGVLAIDGQSESLDDVTFLFAPDLVAIRRESSGPG
jgi:cell division inhibitor SepF